MKCSDVITFAVAQLVAALVYALTFLIIPAILGVILVVVMLIGCFIEGDSYAGLFFWMLMGVGIVYEILALIGIVLFLLSTTGIQLLRHWVRIPWWFPILLVFSVIYVVFIIAPSQIFILGLGASIPFCIYWLVFSGTDATLRCIIRRSESPTLSNN